MLKLVKYPDPVLARSCEQVTEFNDELRALIDGMADIMYSSEGVGLAAPQVGASKRVLLIDPTGGEDANAMLALINPRVTWHSPEMETDQEGCLSLPGAILQVPRSVAVDVEYHDVMGKQLVRRFTEFEARIVQHEVDHLDGVLMIDKVGHLTRTLVMKGLGNNR